MIGLGEENKNKSQTELFLFELPAERPLFQLILSLVCLSYLVPQHSFHSQAKSQQGDGQRRTERAAVVIILAQQAVRSLAPLGVAARTERGRE